MENFNFDPGSSEIDIIIIVTAMVVFASLIINLWL